MSNEDIAYELVVDLQSELTAAQARIADYIRVIQTKDLEIADLQSDLAARDVEIEALLAESKGGQLGT